jgi:hypothetical protein
MTSHRISHLVITNIDLIILDISQISIKIKLTNQEEFDTITRAGYLLTIFGILQIEVQQ